MKILFVIPTLSCGGAEVLTAGLALEFAKKGHQVKILCHFPLPEAYEMIPDRKQLEASVEIIVSQDHVDFHFLRPAEIHSAQLEKLLLEFKPDVVHSNLFLSEVYSRSVLHPHARYFTHVHDNMFQLQKPSWRSVFSKKALTAAWERGWLLKRYEKSNTHFIAISPDVKKFLESNLPRGLQKISLVPNAINTKRFRGRKTTFMQDGKLRMVSVGSLVHKKNHALLISLSAILKEKKITHEIHVYGDGPLRKELQKSVEKLGLDESVFFHGNSGEIPDKMHAADLYIHPATYEPFGLVLLEAMASGLPVISLDGFGNRELVREGENGFLLSNTATAGDILNKIEWFLGDKSRFAAMADKGLEFCKTYDIEVYAEKLMRIYKPGQ